jgi:hypothetical protein
MCSMDKNEMLKVVRQRRLHREFDMLAKQVRMLVELAKRSPVIRGETTGAIVGSLEPEAEYVIVERQRMNELLEGAGLQVFLIKDLPEELNRPEGGGTDAT